MLSYFIYFILTLHIIFITGSTFKKSIFLIDLLFLQHIVKIVLFIYIFLDFSSFCTITNIIMIEKSLKIS